MTNETLLDFIFSQLSFIHRCKCMSQHLAAVKERNAFRELNLHMNSLDDQTSSRKLLLVSVILAKNNDTLLVSMMRSGTFHSLVYLSHGTACHDF